MPTSSAVGVARPSAHGQAMISTATAALNERSRVTGADHHTISVSNASPITIGTNTAEIAIGESLHRRLARLGVVDEAGDLRQLRVGTDTRGAHDQPAVGVDRGTDHVVAGRRPRPERSRR